MIDLTRALSSVPHVRPCSEMARCSLEHRTGAEALAGGPDLACSAQHSVGRSERKHSIRVVDPLLGLLRQIFTTHSTRFTSWPVPACPLQLVGSARTGGSGSQPPALRQLYLPPPVRSSTTAHACECERPGHVMTRLALAGACLPLLHTHRV